MRGVSSRLFESCTLIRRVLSCEPNYGLSHVNKREEDNVKIRPYLEDLGASEHSDDTQASLDNTSLLPVRFHFIIADCGLNFGEVATFIHVCMYMGTVVSSSEVGGFPWFSLHPVPVWHSESGSWCKVGGSIQLSSGRNYGNSTAGPQWTLLRSNRSALIMQNYGGDGTINRLGESFERISTYWTSEVQRK